MMIRCAANMLWLVLHPRLRIALACFFTLWLCFWSSLWFRSNSRFDRIGIGQHSISSAVGRLQVVLDVNDLRAGSPEYRHASLTSFSEWALDEWSGGRRMPL